MKRRTRYFLKIYYLMLHNFFLFVTTSSNPIHFLYRNFFLLTLLPLITTSSCRSYSFLLQLLPIRITSLLLQLVPVDASSIHHNFFLSKLLLFVITSSYPIHFLILELLPVYVSRIHRLGLHCLIRTLETRVWWYSLLRSFSCTHINSPDFREEQ